MFFESYKSLLYSDTLISDIFITEYLPSMDGDFAKVYVYSIFLTKLNKNFSSEEIAIKLHIDNTIVKRALEYFESIGILKRNDKGIVFCDLKEKEINKLYRMKTTSSPEDVKTSMLRNSKRNSIVTAINNTFFQGVMAPSWYTDIDAWFDRFNFDEDVMFALFQHCYTHKGLSKNYILKVAESWHSKSIINHLDLDNYSIEYQNFKDIKDKIVKKLGRKKSPLTEYEDSYIEKWVIQYRFDFDIIEIALMKTTGISSPNFEYINHALTDWYNKGLRNREEILSYISSLKKQSKSKMTSNNNVPQKGNFQQRDYDDDFYNNLYKNLPNKLDSQ